MVERPTTGRPLVQANRALTMLQVLQIIVYQVSRKLVCRPSCIYFLFYLKTPYYIPAPLQLSPGVWTVAIQESVVDQRVDRKRLRSRPSGLVLLRLLYAHYRYKEKTT